MQDPRPVALFIVLMIQQESKIKNEVWSVSQLIFRTQLAAMSLSLCHCLGKLRVTAEANTNDSFKKISLMNKQTNKNVGGKLLYKTPTFAVVNAWGKLSTFQQWEEEILK